MPVLVFAFWVPVLAALFSGLRWVIASSVGLLILQLVLALGVGFVVFSGVDVLLDVVGSEIRTRLGSLGDVAMVFGLLGVDVGINMVLSAMSMALTIRTAGGALKRMVFK